MLAPTPSDSLIKYGNETRRFAVKLYNNAEKAGIKAGYVLVELYHPSVPEGLSAWWYLVAFDTSDRGLVYIDDMGQTGAGLSYNDAIAIVKVGSPYIRQFIPELIPDTGGWYYPTIGIIKSVSVTW